MSEIMVEKLADDIHGDNVGRLKEASKALKGKGDRLSCLHDSLLLLILSLLNMHDVVKTSILSTRWRNLWRSISCLDFQIQNWAAKTDKITFIDRSIFDRSLCSSSIERLRISCIYNVTHVLQFDSWIRFAISKKLVELELDFVDGRALDDTDRSAAHYKLPHALFNCSSIRTISLTLCDLNLPTSVHLTSLQKLTLSSMDMSSDEITNLTSNCPLLESLTLVDCNRLGDLHISISNPNLKNLQIYDSKVTDDETEIMICAPNLQWLTFWYCLPRAKYCLENIKSLQGADFLDFCQEEISWDYNPEDYSYIWSKFVSDLHHVTVLDLCRIFVEVLSIHQPELSYPIPSIKATYMNFDSDLTKWELPGILRLLMRASELETLTISPGNGEKESMALLPEENFKFEEKEILESEEVHFASRLKNLKTVKIFLHSGVTEQGDVEDILRNLDYKIEFVKFILKNSEALEILIIGKSSVSSSKNNELLFKLTEKIVALPRASSKVEISFI